MDPGPILRYKVAMQQFQVFRNLLRGLLKILLLAPLVAWDHGYGPLKVAE